jgi:hypothetical protein
MSEGRSGDEFRSQAEERKKVVGWLFGCCEVVKCHVSWFTEVIPTWHFTEVRDCIAEYWELRVGNKSLTV